jgi:hypothetical protein
MRMVCRQASKFRQAVRFIDNEKSNIPVLDIVKFDLNIDRASIAFRYRPEGIAGDAVFEKAQQIWRIKSIAIREH